MAEDGRQSRGSYKILKLPLGGATPTTYIHTFISRCASEGFNSCTWIVHLKESTIQEVTSLSFESYVCQI